MAVPISQITAFGAFDFARSSVGSSNAKPFTKIMSACYNVAAALGGGSYVWEFVPSGTIP